MLWVYAAAVALSCGDGASRHPGAEAGPPKRSFDSNAYEKTLSHIESQRTRYAARFQRARGAPAKNHVRREARAYVVSAIRSAIFPAWMGTPWGLGRNSTSLRPHQDGMTVGCSYFVTSVLLNAGLRLDNRYTFARAPALHIQRSLAPRRNELHRYLSIPASTLRDQVKTLGDGLYLIGLYNHIGFVDIRGGKVRFVHSGVPSRKVVNESFATAPSIIASQRAGYFVTPLFRDDRLIDMWLTGKSVPFQKLGR